MVCLVLGKSRACSQKVFLLLHESAFSTSLHPFPLPRTFSQVSWPSVSVRLAAPSECGMLPVLFHQLWAASLPSWRGGLSGFFVFERDSLNSKHSKFLAEAADGSRSARAPCLGHALLWSFPDLPATVPKTSVVGYRSKILK